MKTFVFIGRNRWWFGRLCAFPVHVLLFSIAVFFVVRAIPGDPVITATGGLITKDQYDQARRNLGLNGSVIDQLGRYLDRILHGDFGHSTVSGRPVMHQLIQALPQTLELAFLGLFATAAVSVVMSYLLVSRPSNVLSRIVAGYVRFAGAVPLFVFGIALIFVFVTTLHFAPAPIGALGPGLTAPPQVTGFPLLDALIAGKFDVFWSLLAHLVLPVTALVLEQSAMLSRILTPALEDSVAAAPTRFRIACGVSRGDVVRSVFRRALPTSVTMLGTMLGTVIAGAIILEQAFSLGGMGGYIVTAVNSSDIPAVQGFLISVAVIALAVFMLVDIINMLLDPRRRPGVDGGDGQ